MTNNSGQTLKNHTKCQTSNEIQLSRMWANDQRDGRPAKHRWRPLLNAAKFGWRPLLHTEP